MTAKEALIRYRTIDFSKSQEEVAKEMEVSPTTICKIEKGKNCNLQTKGKIQRLTGYVID